jgi:hypothetical protein
MKTNKEKYDPFNEDDWDEVEHDYFIFKIWVGAVSKEIKIICYKPHIIFDNDKDKVFINDDRFRNILKTNIENFFDNFNIRKHIILGNSIIINTDNYNIDDIYNFVLTFLKGRKTTCVNEIDKLTDILNNGYSNDDEDDEYYDNEDIDLDKIRNSIKLENILLSNINSLLNNYKNKILKYIKLYF